MDSRLVLKQTLDARAFELVLCFTLAAICGAATWLSVSHFGAELLTFGKPLPGLFTLGAASVGAFSLYLGARAAVVAETYVFDREQDRVTRSGRPIGRLGALARVVCRTDGEGDVFIDLEDEGGRVHSISSLGNIEALWLAREIADFTGKRWSAPAAMFEHPVRERWRWLGGLFMLVGPPLFLGTLLAFAAWQDWRERRLVEGRCTVHGSKAVMKYVGGEEEGIGVVFTPVFEATLSDQGAERRVTAYFDPGRSTMEAAEAEQTRSRFDRAGTYRCWFERGRPETAYFSRQSRGVPYRFVYLVLGPAFPLTLAFGWRFFRAVVHDLQRGVPDRAPAA